MNDEKRVIEVAKILKQLDIEEHKKKQMLQHLHRALEQRNSKN